jgi:hypothetical protein
MVPKQGNAAVQGEPSDPLEVSQDALVKRLQRRVAALERQLEARIAQVADLQARIAQHQQDRPDPGVDADLRHRAAQYDALMATATMRALRLPRAWYGEVRRRIRR